MNYINYFFDKKNGAIGGIYEDMKHFGKLYPEGDLIFKKGISQLKKGYARCENEVLPPPQTTF